MHSTAFVRCNFDSGRGMKGAESILAIPKKKWNEVSFRVE